MIYKLYINNDVVAIVKSSNKEKAIKEILRYFQQYLTEDFLEIKVVKEE